MIGRGVFGITILFTIVFGAFAAGARAEQRAWTCAPEAGAYSDAHCVNNVAGKFKATEIANGTATGATITNEQTASETTASAVAKLAGVLSGIATEIQCTTVSGSGSLTNSATAVSGTGVFELKGCKVTKPSGRGCKITGESLTTHLINSTTIGQAGFKVKFEGPPLTKKEIEEGKEPEFMKLSLEGCKENIPPNTTVPITGSLVDSVSGATTTITSEESKAQGTLRFGGQVATIEGAVTGRMNGGNPIFLK